MKIICALLVVMGTLLAVSGCNTVRGLGEDVEDAGDAVKDAAN